MDHVYGAVMMV